MADTTGTRWSQIKGSNRHGTEPYGQASDGTGLVDDLAKYNADGSLTDSGIPASSLASLSGYGGGSGTIGAPTVVQSSISTVDNTHSVPFPSNNTAGNCILVAVRYGADPGTISDSQGNTYTLVQSQFSAFAHYQKCWIAPNIKAGANTLTLSNKAAVWILIELSGIVTASPVDASVIGTSLTTTAASDEVFMVGGAQGTAALTQTETWTLIQGGGGIYGGTPQELFVWGASVGSAGVYTNTASGSDTEFLIALKTNGAGVPTVVTTTASSTSGSTSTGALTKDQLVVGNGGSDLKILPAGVDGQVLMMVAGIPTWTNSAASSPILDSSGNPILDSSGNWIFPG